MSLLTAAATLVCTSSSTAQAAGDATTSQAAAAPAQDNTAMATYNTEVFPYWHLTAEGWKMPSKMSS